MRRCHTIATLTGEANSGKSCDMAHGVPLPALDVLNTLVNVDLFIEFDQRQLTFRTNVVEAREYVAATFRHMLVAGVSESAGQLAFLETENGYAVISAEVTEFAGVRLEELMPLVKDEVRLQFMRSRPDLLWMHAAAVERAGGALLLSGISGQGKSTLSTYLCEHGWRFLSDDVSPVRMDADQVIPFPQVPVRRLHPGREVSREELGTLDRQAVEVATEALCTGEPEIRGIVFIAYAAGAKASLRKLERGSAALEILRNSTNFFDHKGEAVGRAAGLANRMPMYALAYSLPWSAADLLNALW